MQFAFKDQIITVNMPTRDALLAEVRHRFATGRGFALATINLDHVAKMTVSRAFARVYADQDLVVADGFPVVVLSRLAGTPVELMPGSDLIVPLCRVAVESGAKIAFVGSTEQALGDAARILSGKVPGLDIVLAESPPMGFDPDGAAAREVCAQIVESGTTLCFLALGAPKQEAFAAMARRFAPHVGFASIGAGLDFLGGHQARAPLWMRRTRIEWLWRAATSPRRLVPRYARCFAILPAQVVQALRQRR